ncbi:MAG: hypothetical protein VKM01_03385, partial [Cyanobacteriota bacterium]|nr:hypothetical protein [Cyanobacteriota bacterium]
MIRFREGQDAGITSTLEQAMALARLRLQTWAADRDGVGRVPALLRQVFGASGEPVAALRRAITTNRLHLDLVLLDGASMGGALGGYLSSTSLERIVLNSTWLQNAPVAAVEAVLLEEIGHAIDRRLNGAHDTPGDEGEIFSAL